MHYVPKGSEPKGLKSVRDKHTSRWIDYYRHRTGTKPAKNHWRRFINELRNEFKDLCGYCEHECRGEVDHFKPKSKSPEEVYVWENWVFACHDCNHGKGEQWPDEGYVFPCAAKDAERPESYFTFDTITGEILPRPDLKQRNTARAWRTIDDLNLNAFHHLKGRISWLRMIRYAVDSGSPDAADLRQLIEWLTSRRTRYSSVARGVLQEMGLFNA